MSKPNSVRPNRGYNYVHARGVEGFPYFVGVDSLAQVATREDRVCVFNILGHESRGVTPISHEYSGGNVVCGTMPGRSGAVLATSIGDIPVYNNVLEALNAGHRFDVSVLYLPPGGVKDAVIEAARVNPQLKKIFILTEKVPVRDARTIRQYCQWGGVDVFGANSLGAADAHHHVRIGGALGGSSPHESLIPGSVAIYSNSGNFTTTLAVYLPTAGWGTTVSISSGKDVYIHFGVTEFAHALENDSRSKAAVMYIEPGGYYERDVTFSKPVVVCVVGHWKARLTRPCGHAGAIIGEGDSAADKERWFLEKFGVDRLFTPKQPICSPRGAVVNNISYVPQALTEVMKLNGVEPDFEPRGTLRLKCWFTSSQGIELPVALKTPVVEAVKPYGQQINEVNRRLGVLFARRSMNNASGASRMDPKTQITSIHGVSVLDGATRSFEESLVQGLIREYPDSVGRTLANIALNTLVNQHGTPMLSAAEAARAEENSPNTVLSAALAIVGPRRTRAVSNAAQTLVDLFGQTDLRDPCDDGFDFDSQLQEIDRSGAAESLVAPRPSEDTIRMLGAIDRHEINSVFVRFLRRAAERLGGHVSRDALLAALTCHIAWRPLMRKRLSVRTVVALPWHFQIFGTLVGASVPTKLATADQFCGVELDELVETWSFGATACMALIGRRPTAAETQAASLLFGLVSTNGPGTISAQGAKGPVSADGPEAPERVQINKAYVGFLTHTGFAHGGNGYEAIAFLIEQFKDRDLVDPGNPNHDIDLAAMAHDCAESYLTYKSHAKEIGDPSYRKIPCVNHPVFKGQEVNYDPRETFVSRLMEDRGEYNIFHRFYHELVRALFEVGVSRNVYCVNVDAMIAVILLKMLWNSYCKGELSDRMLERTAFTSFLFGRMIGTAAEIEDHVNRGRNMDTRTPASQCIAVG